MYNMKIKMKFVQFKAVGMPMYKISEELGVHRTTLTMWHKELAPYILIAKQDAIDELLFENENLKLHRIEVLSRHLKVLYEILDLKHEDKKDLDVITHLDLIAKVTKLLKAETGEKSIENFMAGSYRKINIKTMQPVDEDDDDAFFEEAPIWITDSDKFGLYQPEDDCEQYYGLNLDNAVELATPEEFPEVNFNPFSVEDISKKEPAVQEIFKRTRRRASQKQDGLEESVKNSSQEKKDEKQESPDKQSDKESEKEPPKESTKKPDKMNK